MRWFWGPDVELAGGQDFCAQAATVFQEGFSPWVACGVHPVAG